MKKGYGFITVLLVSICLVFAGFLAEEGLAAPLNWSSPMTVTMGSTVLSGPLELASDFRGDYHLLYYNEDLRWMGYGHHHDGVWSLEPATDPVFTTWHDYSLSMWGSIPYAAYYDESAGGLRMGYACGSGWSDFGVDDSFGAVAVSHAVSEYGNAHLLWVRWVGGIADLVYTHDEPGSEWASEFVAPFGDIPRYLLEIELDSSGAPHLSWYDADYGRIWYATRRGPGDFQLETVAAVDTVYWLDLEILAGDTPYIGFLDSASSSEIALRSAHRSGGDWEIDLDIGDEPWIYSAAMAFGAGESVDAENACFVYSTDDGFKTAYRDDGWQTEPLAELDGYDPMVSIGLARSGLDDSFGLALIGPTSRAISFLTATPESLPGDEDLALELLMNQAEYAAGDDMRVDLDAAHPGAARIADLYVLLDVFGEYWFYPGWTQSIDGISHSFGPGATETFAIIDPFELPTPLPAGGPFYFHAAAFTPGSLDAAALISNIDSVEFAFI